MTPLGRLNRLCRFVQVACLVFAALCKLPNANAGFSFTPGHFYSASNGVGSQDIYEYSETGTFLSSMTPRSLIPGDELRGIAFGPDGFLYAVRIHFAELGFQILALDSSGRTQAAYTKGDIGLGGDSGYGKIAFDQQYIYVAGGGVVVRFTFGDPNSGTSIYSNNGIIDVKPLPNGDLFVAWAYGVDEITNTGTFVRSIPLIGADWSNVQGIEYDPAVNKLFATELGYTGFDSPLMRIDASTGVLENWVYFNYGNDLFLTQSNTLLVGSYTQAPGIFDENLISIGSLGTEARVFVTQCAVGSPTPTPTATPSATATPTASPTCSPGGAGPWVMGNPYPTPNDRYGFAQTSTHFYVFAGAGGLPTNAVNRMEIATGTWEPRAPMPSNATAPTCALMEATGIVYCGFGFLNQSFAAYNIATDSWTSLAQVPTIDSYGSASGAFNGKVFLVGGTFFTTNAVWVYDVATNTWSAGTSAPSEVSFPGYRQTGQFLYVVGGWDSNSPATNKTTTWRLDMGSAPGVWENGPTFTPARADFGLAYDPGTNALYALGGDLNGGDYFESTTEVDQLPLDGWPGGTWTASPPNLPFPERQGNQAGFYGAGEIWSVGGLNGQTSQLLTEVLHRPNDCPGASPTPTPTATFTPTPTATATATPTATVRPMPTPRSAPSPRPRPTPAPRP
jgi:Kelch motif